MDDIPLNDQLGNGPLNGSEEFSRVNGLQEQIQILATFLRYANAVSRCRAPLKRRDSVFGIEHPSRHERPVHPVIWFMK